MSEKTKKIIAAAMLFAGALLILMFGIRSVPEYQQKYPATSRLPSIPAISMPDGTVSINDADAEELTSLYGIGETLASLIIDERSKNGPFYYPEDLTAVKGIGIIKMNGFRDSINLE